MDKIFYIDSSLLGECKRSKWGRYTIVMIEEKLTFGKVKVSTWGFDIPFAYSPVNHVGFDVVEENDIKELNWHNILNDFQKDYNDRKYTIWYFLRHNYPCESSLIDNFNKDKTTYQVVYWDGVEIARREYDNNNLPEWCKGQDILWEMDCVIDYMIDHDIEKENCKQLKEMKFKNAIQKGDFVMLRTAYQIMDKFNGVELDNCPIIGGRAIKFPDGDVLILEPNLRLELGNVVRIKSVSDSRQDKRIFFHAENNGIKYQYEDGDDLSFDDRSVEAVMINGIWYDADSEICFD